MSNLKILLKNNFAILLGRLQGKKNRKSTTTAISLLILGIIGIFALYSLQSWSMFKGLGSMGLGKLCVFHGIITTLTTLLIIGIMRVTGKTKTNDSDFLLSLPIKKRDIIISKLINKYLFDLFFSTLLLLPFIVMYEITAVNFSAMVLIFGCITVFILPLLSVGVSQIMEFIVVRLFNKIKYGNVLKSLIPTLVYIALLTLMIIKTSGYGTVQFESMEAYFQDRWFSNQVLSFIFDQSWLSILVVLSITLVPAIIGILLYINIFGKNFGIYSNKKTSIELNKKQSPFYHLLKKEIKLYFSTPAYLVNTIIGPILILIISIVGASGGLNTLLGSLSLSFPEKDFFYLFIVLINFCIAMTCISCVSISLEGKTFWFLQVLPVSTNQIFLSKLCVPLLIVSPTLLISAISAGIMFHNFISAFIVFGISFLFLLINDISGLLINLWLPKLNWENETQVVKQSLSVLLAMVLNTIIAFIPVVIYLLFNINLSVLVIISVALYLAFLITFTFLLFTTGKKLFYKLKQ